MKPLVCKAVICKDVKDSYADRSATSAAAHEGDKDEGLVPALVLVHCVDLQALQWLLLTS